MAFNPGSRTNLLQLYRHLLRSAANYPSRNRVGIYNSIRDEFRENAAMNPEDDFTREKVALAYKGLSQLRQFDVVQMTGGNGSGPNWEVQMEQNPMPKPAEYTEK